MGSAAPEPCTKGNYVRPDKIFFIVPFPSGFPDSFRAIGKFFLGRRTSDLPYWFEMVLHPFLALFRAGPDRNRNGFSSADSGSARRPSRGHTPFHPAHTRGPLPFLEPAFPYRDRLFGLVHFQTPSGDPLSFHLRLDRPFALEFE